jgi:hypothetical protein
MGRARVLLHCCVLHGKRIIEWSDGQVRTAARQLIDSVWSTEDLDPVGAIQQDNGSKSKPETKQETPIYESPEERELFEKTLAAIWEITALRRPILGSTIKGAGVSERHFPVELRPFQKGFLVTR